MLLGALPSSALGSDSLLPLAEHLVRLCSAGSERLRFQARRHWVSDPALAAS